MLDILPYSLEVRHGGDAKTNPGDASNATEQVVAVNVVIILGVGVKPQLWSKPAYSYSE